jgi:putrescine transport system substrate-binding protein
MIQPEIEQQGAERPKGSRCRNADSRFCPSPDLICFRFTRKLEPTPMRLSLFLVACLAVAVTAARAEERVVNIYNWSDYIDPKLLEQFTAETGIKVRYDVYDSLETLEGKLLAGHSGYDVIVPSAQPTLQRLVRAGALRPLDRTKLPNLAGLDPGLMQRVATADPGNKYGAIYLWGSTGLGIDPAKIAALLPDAPTDSWDLLFEPDIARRLAKCGIIMMDSAIDVIPTVLHYLGKNPDSTDPADLAAVEKTLMAIRPYIRTFANGGAIEQMASGEACVTLDYSGDVIQAAQRAREAGKGVTLRYVAPKQGAELTFDTMAIPKDAPHPDEALAFLNFVLRPASIAAITNFVHYPNAVPASRPMIDKAILDDPGIYPPPEQFVNFFETGPVPADVARTRGRLWARFRAGH